MPKICVVGGQLQGLEAAFLAREAGYEVLLVDKDPLVPARGLANQFCNIDLINNEQSTISIFQDCDLILPANENYHTLLWVADWAERLKVPLALDIEAYRISSSKILSNKLFDYIRTDTPRAWPDCNFPVIVKPSGLSGSSGVKKVNNNQQLQKILNEIEGEIVIQEYVEGPSYSLEVVAHQGKCICLQITQLEFDKGYDCKRILAGPRIGNDVSTKFYNLAHLISQALNLSGIMDIEVIKTNDNKLKVLEIDARLPSQTPTAVYFSSGLNMVKVLADYWVNGELPNLNHFNKEPQAVIYEHLKLENGILEVSGEHCLVGAQQLKVYRNKFFAETIIGNFESFSDTWVMTLIFKDTTMTKVWEKRNNCINSLLKNFKIKKHIDPSPRKNIR